MARARNTDVIEFTSPTSDWAPVDPTYFGLWNHATNTANSNFIGGVLLTSDNDAPEEDARIRFIALALSITVQGGLRGVRERDILKQQILGTSAGGATTITDANVWVSLHTGDPGNTGSNELTSANSPGYTRATATNWTIDQV